MIEEISYLIVMAGCFLFIIAMLSYFIEHFSNTKLSDWLKKENIFYLIITILAITLLFWSETSMYCDLDFNWDDFLYWTQNR